MANTRTHFYCWAFCLSFACMLTWFVPVQTLFAVPIPRAADGDPPAMTRYQVPEATRWVRQYETVFGSYTQGQELGLQSATAWDGSSIHLLVTVAVSGSQITRLIE